ncbi:MAG: ATP-binding protein [Gammaproteobacteria bacterium]|nr:ATP-binding protein [Gammaproteobacteria bacterium]
MRRYAKKPGHWAVGFLLMAVLSYLYINTQAVVPERHTRVIDNLRQLHQLDAALNQDFLKVRYGLLAHYDTLMDTSIEIIAVQNRLNNTLKAADMFQYDDINLNQKKVIEAFEHKVDLLEQLKSQVSVLKNSLNFLPIAATQTKALALTRDEAHPLIKYINLLEHYTLAYNLTSDQVYPGKIEALLPQLLHLQSQWDTPLQQRINNLMTHVKVIVQQKIKVDSILQELMTLPTSRELNSLYNVYQRHNESLLIKANGYRLALYLISILLLAYVGYILFKLEGLVVQRTLELADTNASLKQEIIERKQMEKQLIQAKESALKANSAKSEFLANMSHELRTPLNSIIGFAGIMKSGMAGKVNEEQARQLQMIYGSASHLLELINDILDLSKVESGKLKVIKEAFELMPLLEEIKALMMAQIGSKDLSLKLVGHAPKIVYTDRGKLRQILFNLMGNAIKFTERGSVTLVCRQKNHDVVLEVVDTGIGISEEDQGKVFGAFEQVDTRTEREYEGTGLGLAISQRFAKLLGGKITVHSQLGKGSTFRIVLHGVFVNN